MASKSNLSQMSVEDLNAKLRTVRTLQRTVGAIFFLIVLAWVMLGYWKTNTPVFISTLCVAVASLTAVTASSSGLRAELRKREIEASRGN
jgi:ABC-type transport system involved in cytochrome c biogenesis permease component